MDIISLDSKKLNSIIQNFVKKVLSGIPKSNTQQSISDKVSDLIEKPTIITDNQLQTKYEVEIPNTTSHSASEERQLNSKRFSSILDLAIKLMEFMPDEFKEQIQDLCGIQYTFICLIIVVIREFTFFEKGKKSHKRVAEKLKRQGLEVFNISLNFVTLHFSTPSINS